MVIEQFLPFFLCWSRYCVSEYQLDLLTDNTTMNINISSVFGDLTFDQRILQNNIHVFFF